MKLKQNEEWRLECERKRKEKREREIYTDAEAIHLPAVAWHSGRVSGRCGVRGHQRGRQRGHQWVFTNGGGASAALITTANAANAANYC